jgi:septal ring factor EnvC (AmiA/AmiB activator)
MSRRSRRVAGALVVTVLGLWGCSQAPSNAGSTAQAEKLKAVEAKLARLEDDFRAAASARDQLHKKLLAAEEARTALQAQSDRQARELKAKDELIRVRDEQLTARTAERDQVTGQYKSFRDGLRELLARAEEKPESPTVPVIPTSNPKPEVPDVVLPPVPGR